MEVTGMFKYKEKIGNSAGATKSTDRLIRLLRSDMAFQAPPNTLEATDREDAFDNHQKEAGNPVLEAEYRKAKAIMTMQQHRSFG